MQCTDAIEWDLYHCAGCSGDWNYGPVGWWENFRANYPRAGQVDSWGAGTKYKEKYWHQGNGNTAITLQVDIQ